MLKIAQSDLPLHNLHDEHHKYEQCTTISVTIHTDADIHVLNNDPQASGLQIKLIELLNFLLSVQSS